MLEGNGFDVIGFLALAELAAAQYVPAMIGGYFIEPRGEGAALIVLGEFVAQLHENLHGRVFRIFMGGHGPPAKTENRRGILPVQIAPSVDIPGPSPDDQIRRFRFSRRAHSPWSQRFHRLVRRNVHKTIIDCYRSVGWQELEEPGFRRPL